MWRKRGGKNRASFSPQWVTLLPRIRSSTAVKVKGVSGRPKGNDHKPGGPSFCRKGKQGKTV